jgi:hypothetical protein
LICRNPDELLAECTAEIDGRWRHMATRAAAGEVNVGADGRLHAAALKAITAPDTLRAAGPLPTDDAAGRYR